MKISIRFKSNNHTLAAFLTYLVCFSINVEQVLSAGGSDPQPTTTEASVISPPVQNAGSLTVTPTTLLQTGSNNFANVNSNVGALNYPNCSGSCAFGILRTNPSNFNGTIGNQIEAVIGVVISLGSPEQSNAETNRQMVEIQKNSSEFQIIQTLGDKLADAIEAGKTERANIIAMMLAPKLGKTHIQLLREAKLKI
jgi:hypothetical protein